MLVFTVAANVGGDVAVANGNDLEEESLAENEDLRQSLWDSPPVEQFEANIQILDKISGKAFRQKIKVGNLVAFGTIGIRLRRCFRNSPEEKKEVYAFVEVEENGHKIFSNWLFASSLSVNLFSHPVYDIRVEFNETGAK